MSSEGAFVTLRGFVLPGGLRTRPGLRGRSHGSRVAGRVLDRSFYERDPREVAPDLLGKVLVRGEVAARIVEVEAYGGGDDPGSHAWKGPSRRNATMFGRPGLLYVYFTYGMHWCANAVCGREGEGSAVLLRAAAPLAGLETMKSRRVKARTERDLLSGPAKLCQAFGIDGSADGADLVTGDEGIVILDDGVRPRGICVSTRIGLSRGAEFPWRWFVEGDPNVSRGGSRVVRSDSQGRNRPRG
ncbi:MAG: putative 3-methyladenine DNA glycosylase [Acidimicrobiales bacterium]|nr:MAG: putative 3-methyladenine DNA glycosylase [Acidimicrobiales bacterium]